MHRPAPLRKFAPPLPLNAAQRLVNAEVRARAQHFGSRPGQDGRSDLLTMIKSQDLYSEAPLAVRPYVPEEFKSLSSGIIADSLYDRLPPEGKCIMNDFPSAFRALPPSSTSSPSSLASRRLPLLGHRRRKLTFSDA